MSSLARAVSVVGLCLIAPASASAQLTDIGFRVAGADVVMVARVCGLTAAFEVTEVGEIIVSRAKLCPGEVLKGDWDTDNVFVIEGGTVGDVTLELSHLPLLHLGDRALFLLDRSPLEPGAFRLSDGGYGYFELLGRVVSDFNASLTVSMATVRKVARAADTNQPLP